MKKIFRNALISLLLFSCALPPRLQDNVITIYNNSESDINIQLGEATEKLTAYTIKKKESWISPIFRNNPEIKLQTNDIITSYMLSKGKSYMVYWNGSKKRWDLTTIRKR